MSIPLVFAVAILSILGGIFSFTYIADVDAQFLYSVDIVNGASSQANPIYFNPSIEYVPAGSTVTWTNHDTTSHTVTSVLQVTGPLVDFDSGIIASGSTYNFSFATPGIFSYYCTIHPFMRGQVVVS